MARKARLHVPGGLYHVTLRGNHRQPIFLADSDRTALESFVADAIRRHDARVHAFCWMTNHIHLLVQVATEPLGRVMQCIGTRHARFVQRRIETTGHLFERRYHALLVDSERYLLALVRYIHLNPVRGGLVAEPAAYPWSSHRCYLGLETRPWLTTERTLGMLAADPVAARTAYRKYVAEAAAGPIVSPLADGTRCDGRILGDDGFRDQLPAPACDTSPSVTLDELIARTCEEFSVAPALVLSASRARALNRVRTIILLRALEGRIANCSEVARRFGRSAAALSQSARRARQDPRQRSLLAGLDADRDRATEVVTSRR